MTREIKIDGIPSDKCLLMFRYQQEYEEALASSGIKLKSTNKLTKRETVVIFCNLCQKFALKANLKQNVLPSGEVEKVRLADDEPVRDNNRNIICTDPN